METFAAAMAMMPMASLGTNIFMVEQSYVDWIVLLWILLLLVIWMFFFLPKMEILESKKSCEFGGKEGGNSEFSALQRLQSITIPMYEIWFLSLIESEPPDQQSHFQQLEKNGER